MKKSLQQLEWLQNELTKDKIVLDQEKSKLIENIKKLKREDILPKPPKKLTLWQRIKKVLMG
jgi:hypothetical protein